MDQPSRDKAELMNNFHASHAKLVTRLATTLFEELLQPRYINDPEAPSPLLWIGGDTFEHYQEHRTILEAVGNA